MLARAAVRSVAQLQSLGAVAAFARARCPDPKASLNLLSALEAALSGQPWQVVASEHRTSLLLALEPLQQGADAAQRPADGKRPRPAPGRGGRLA